MFSRFRTLVLIAALTVLATAFAACGGSDGDGGSGGGNAQAVVDEATLDGVKSGNLDLALGVKIEGDKPGEVDVSLSGPFKSEGKGQLPQLDMTAKANGSVGDEDVDFDGGLVLLSNKAYVNYEGTEYEVDPTTFSFVKSNLQGGGGGQSDEATACQDAVGELNVADFVENLSEDGSADVGGTSTTKVSGDLNIGGAIDLLVDLGEDPACSAQLKAAGPIPSAAELEEAKDEVQSALKDAHVDLYVGDDHIVRRISAQLTIEPQDSGDGGAETVELDVDLTLTEVNEDQTISAPSGAKPLSDLFLKLGINPIELLGALNGEGGLGGSSGGLGGLLEGLSDGSGGSSSGGDRQAYLECLQTVKNAADLQRCAGLK